METELKPDRQRELLDDNLYHSNELLNMINELIRKERQPQKRHALLYYKEKLNKIHNNTLDLIKFD